MQQLLLQKELCEYRGNPQTNIFYLLPSILTVAAQNIPTASLSLRQKELSISYCDNSTITEVGINHLASRDLGKPIHLPKNRIVSSLKQSVPGLLQEGGLAPAAPKPECICPLSS